MFRFQSLDALSDTIQRELAAKIVSKMLFQQLIFHIFTSLFLNEDIFLCMGIEDTQGIYNNSRFSTS